MDLNKETIILEQLAHDETPVRQRDLAHITGLSLGMANALLKRMAIKGFIIMERINSRNIKYILTPKGREELNKRSKNFIKKTIKNVVYYRDVVESLVKKIKSQGYDTVALVGISDLDFILEWACLKHQINFVKKAVGEKTFVVFSEKATAEDINKINSESISVLELEGVNF